MQYKTVLSFLRRVLGTFPSCGVIHSFHMANDLFPIKLPHQSVKKKMNAHGKKTMIYTMCDCIMGMLILALFIMSLFPIFQL